MRDVFAAKSMPAHITETNNGCLVMTAKPKTHRARTIYSFTLRVAGVHELDEKLEDALFEAGCDDALLSTREGELQIAFDREADNLLAAVVSAINDVEGAGLGLKISEVAIEGAEEVAKVNAALQLRDVAPDLLQCLTR